MTVIKFYGILAKNFGEKIKLHLGSRSNIIDAIDSIKQGFRKKLLQIRQEGNNYSFLFSKNGKEINILPIICGSKWIGLRIARWGKRHVYDPIIKPIFKSIATPFVWLAKNVKKAFHFVATHAWAGILLAVVGLFILGPAMAAAYSAAGGGFAGVSAAAMASFGGGFAMSTSVAATVGAFGITLGTWATIGSIVLSLGITLAMTAYKLKSLSQQKNAKQEIDRAVGGTAARVATRNKSYIFSNTQNVAFQGMSVPIGYGKTRIGSKIISISIKNFPVTTSFSNASQSLQNNFINFND
jgi:predicted phage tail protein